MSSSLYSLPDPDEEGSDGVALTGSWHPARFNPLQYLAILQKTQTTNQPNQQKKKKKSKTENEEL